MFLQSNICKLLVLIVLSISSNRTNFTFSQMISTNKDEQINESQSLMEVADQSIANETSEEKIFKLNSKECIYVKTEEGIYSFVSDGQSNLICGLYLLANPNFYVEIEFLQFDISCAKKGLLSVVDGWELSGQFFPGVEDHLIPREARYHEFCGHIKPKKIFRMSQNVGLLEYRVPSAGQGFMVRVRFIENPKPCNAVIQDLYGIYTLRNYGRRINCTVSIIFGGNFQIMSMNIGQSYRRLDNLLSIRNYVVETGVIKKCKKRGMEDYVELRGGNGLDPHLMTVAEDLCGFRPFTYKKRFTVSCAHTAVRLVSSGNYDNMVEFGYKATLDQSPFSSLICPTTL